ncbi:LysR family transcriptional regulator [Exilibacterium tricleocarpae]|uniref:LysR family transcriptional regulator n=1 Tax=Exilibacterium tricleocarpae TaxID=2591008 RepID=A0A545TZJ2_9GAMM|nr:LysR family transcriptional regulator [Exilibacterium tricleocarpae]TQV82625.1 LysR family transcriptional regulator [Exilibacterium tricleocarpae]
MPSDIRLRYLYESARLGTMRAASEELDVATSSVSRQIAELEAELGLALIERGRRKIKLTEAGEASCQYYREKLSQEEAFLSKIKELKSIRTGKIVLAVGEAYVTQRFSDMLQAFMQNYPGMEVQVEVANTSAVVDLVREDNAHMGLIFDIPRDPKIHARLVLPQPLMVIVNARHAFSQQTSINLASLQGESIGLPEENYRIRQIIHTAEQEDGVFLEASLLTNSLTLITDFVKSGRGIAILPELVVQQELTSGDLIALPVSNRILNSTKTSLITRAGRQLPVGAYRLLLGIEAHLKSEVRRNAAGS